MGAIQLAEELTAEFGEVVVVIDEGQDLTIAVGVALPVHAMEISVVELILHLPNHMVVDVCPLLSWGVLKASRVGEGSDIPALDLLEAVVAKEVEGLPILAHLQRAATGVANDLLSLLLGEVETVKVGLAVEGGEVVELVSLGSHSEVRLRSTRAGDTDDTLVAIGEVEDERLYLVLILALLILLSLFLLVLVALICALLLLILVLQEYLALLLVEEEAIVCVLIEEHQVDVCLRAPRAVAAVAGVVAVVGDCFPVEDKASTDGIVSGLGEIDQLAGAVRLDEGDIGVIPASIAHEVGQDMPRVGTPGKPLVSVRVGVVVLLIQHLGTLAAGKVKAVDCSAIP